jgi:hypothetical protein
MIQTVETYENGVLISTEQIEVPDLPDDTSNITAVIDAMTPAQLDAMRNLLGL